MGAGLNKKGVEVDDPTVTADPNWTAKWTDDPSLIEVLSPGCTPAEDGENRKQHALKTLWTRKGSFRLQSIRDQASEHDANFGDIQQGVVDEAVDVIKAFAAHKQRGAPNAIPGLSSCGSLQSSSSCTPDGVNDLPLSVKEWRKKGVKAEARAIKEVLHEFKSKIVTCSDEPDARRTIGHAYIMCRVGTGFHCFGLYLEADTPINGSKIRMILFDPSHGPYVRTQTFRVEAVKLLMTDASFAEVCDPYFMVPLWHFRQQSSSESTYKGITSNKKETTVCKVINQLALHRGNECGMISYFAMTFFAILHSSSSRSLFDCLNLQSVDFIHVVNSVWDGKPLEDGNKLQSETVPASYMFSDSTQRERLANCDQFAFKALPFPQAFESFSEFAPLGSISIDGVTSVRKEQLWIKELRDVGLLPIAGDKDFRRNSYLSLLLGGCGGDGSGGSLLPTKRKPKKPPQLNFKREQECLDTCGRTCEDDKEAGRESKSQVLDPDDDLEKDDGGLLGHIRNPCECEVSQVLSLPSVDATCGNVPTDGCENNVCARDTKGRGEWARTRSLRRSGTTCENQPSDSCADARSQPSMNKLAALGA